MPRMNQTGPEGKGPGTGRKLGTCHIEGSNLTEPGHYGLGLGKRFHASGGMPVGKGKRLRYFQNKLL